MNTMKMIVSVAAAFLLYIATVAASEVCQWQEFEAKCADDEVIVMKEARYGRMKVGKCLSRNYFVGCSADVVEYMHGRCSGRRHCRVPVPDPIMFAASPCPKDLVSYLEADYECVKVAKWDKESCDNVMTATSGLIAKPADTVADIRKKHHCPRRIVAQPGQTINVYLSDFYNQHHQHESNDATVNAPIPECITYGHIAEDGTSAPAKVCGGELKFNQLVYRSKSNVVDITLSAPNSHAHHYLIKYEVIGCPNVDAPYNGWVEIKKDTAIVHCNNSHTASELVCSGNQWVGEVQNCSPLEMPMAVPVSDNMFASTGVLVGVSIGVAVVVLVGIGLLVFVITLFSSRAKQLPADQQSSQTDLLQKTFKAPQEGSYNYLPVVDPNYVPVADDNLEYGSKAFVPSNAVQHIVNHLYEAPRANAQRVNLTSFNDFANTLEARLPALENAYGPLGGRVCAEHKQALPIYNVYDLTGLASQGHDNVIVMDN